VTFYHEGNRTHQQLHDGTWLADRLEEVRVHHQLWEDEVAQIETAPFFFLAAATDDAVDCSFKGGEPGFVKVTGPATAEWPDYDGNSMYRSLGNISRNPKVGLLFVPIDGQSPRLRINGRAAISHEPTRLSAYPGAKAIVAVECDFIYKNCNRHLLELTLSQPSPFNPKPGYAAPQPEWKSRDYARDVLPLSDDGLTVPELKAPR
jgi:predicted pyridoxine 5'-phosphate oxidase superfamily flavin-nucleotide-binding protein